MIFCNFFLSIKKYFWSFSTTRIVDHICGAKSKNDEVNPCPHADSFVNINFYCPASRTCSGNAFSIVATMSRVGSRHAASAILWRRRCSFRYRWFDICRVNFFWQEDSCLRLDFSPIWLRIVFLYEANHLCPSTTHPQITSQFWGCLEIPQTDKSSKPIDSLHSSIILINASLKIATNALVYLLKYMYTYTHVHRYIYTCI